VSYVHLPPYRVTAHPLAAQSEGVDWGVSSYGVPALWKKSQGEGVVVAVVDSGVAPHYALKDVVVDYRNFTSDSDIYDTLGHGTHCAGVIGAATGNAKGIAPKCKIHSLKVLGHSGMGSNDSVAEAVRYATEIGVDIISMSLGSSRPDDHLHTAIKEAYEQGIVVVCAAGNDGGAVNYPAAFRETIGVGAVDKSGQACEFSSRGKEIVVAAPGSDITSTWLQNGYATISGTSMAAPFVAGVLALYISSAKQEGEKVDHKHVIDALSKTCKDAGADGHDDVYGWGLVDPHKLMHYEIKATPSGITIYIPGAKIL
jgi:subtilisin family serine protease